MPMKADNIKVGDIVVMDCVTFGTPTFGPLPGVKYRVDTRYDGQITLETMEGAPVAIQDDLVDRGLSILWVYKVVKPTNEERMEERRKQLCNSA